MLNLNNIENFVFLDKKLKQKLPEYNHLFDQWHLAVTLGLTSIKNKALLDFLNIIKKEHVQVIENHLNDTVSVDKSLTYRSIRLVESELTEIETNLNEINPKGNFSVYRDATKAYICFWQ